MSNQPEALRLADALESGTYLLSRERDATAAELRRQHAEIERLKVERDALRAELREATEAVDDPAVNNLRTLPEAIHMLRTERDALAKRMSRCKNDLRVLRNAVDAMMAGIGYHGAIGSRDGRVQKVMDALAASDWAAVFSADEDQDEQP